MTMTHDDYENWLQSLAGEYDGPKPPIKENDVIHWLKIREKDAQDTAEQRRIKDMLEEAELVGSSDDWGTVSPELVHFARFLEMLKSKADGG